MIAYIVNSGGVTVFFNGNPIRMESSHRQYGELLKALADSDEEKVNEILSFEDSVEFENLHPVLVEKLKQIKKQGFSCAGLKNFLERLSQNPSAASIAELYDFLSYKSLPITEDGHFIAYKGVKEDYYSICGNDKTKVLKGVVKNGHILNDIGAEIEVARNQVDDVRENECSFGLHVGSFDYANRFGERTLAVKVDPKDVVSVPKDYNFQKMRVCRYVVLSEVAAEKKQAVTTPDGKKILSEWEETLERVSEFVHKDFSFREILTALNLTEQKLIIALNELGIDWTLDDGEYYIL